VGGVVAGMAQTILSVRSHEKTKTVIESKEI